MEVKYYYMDSDNHRQGPVGADKISTLPLGSYVWRKGLKDWAKVCELPEFRSYYEEKTSTRAIPFDVVHGPSNNQREGLSSLNSSNPEKDVVSVASGSQEEQSDSSSTSALSYFIYSLLCFAGMAIVIWGLCYMFSESTGRIRVRGIIFIAPFYLGWLGFKNLYLCLQTLCDK